MPIYEFSCGKCGNLAEVLLRVGGRPPPCPACGSKRMTRAVSRTSFQLKGGGWYADLYSTPRPGASKPEGGEASTGAEPTPVTASPPVVDGAKGAPAAAPAAKPAVKAEPASKDPGPEKRARPKARRPGR